MEKYLSNKTSNILNQIIIYIKESKEYKDYLKLSEKISEDENLLAKIDNLKEKQKEYIRSNKDEKIKKELDKLREQLEENIVYFKYNDCVHKINEKINLIKDELNDYFLYITNILK